MGHVVLAGGGHANVLALLQLAKITGARENITLLSDGDFTPYSGMLPGYIAGSYRREQCFINLKKTAAMCGVRFINARVCGINGRELLLSDGARQPFDVLSLNVGASQPPLPSLREGASPAECAVKPIGDFMQWLAAQEAVEAEGNEAGGGLRFSRLAVVGGGAGGVETLLALAHRWRRRAGVQLLLVTRRLLPHSTAAMRRHVRRRMAAHDVEVLEGAEVTAYEGSGGGGGGALLLADGRRVPCCRVVHATPVAAYEWFARTGLPCDEAGFLRVNEFLQSQGAAQIFISGDAAAHASPLPKAGVMAVRQGALLAHNLPIAAGWRGYENGALKKFNPSARALFIIGDGDGVGAVASRNGITLGGTLGGRLAWRWKQYLDFAFMNKFAR